KSGMRSNARLDRVDLAVWAAAEQARAIEQRQLNSEGGSIAFHAGTIDDAAVQIHTAFGNHQPQAAAGGLAHVAAAIKSGKEAGLVGFGDAATVIADDELGVVAVARKAELD